MPQAVVEAGLVIDADVRQVEIQARDGDGRRRQVVLDPDARLEFLEAFLPPAAKGRVADIVIAGDPQRSVGLVFRNVVRKPAQVELLGIGRLVRPCGHPCLALCRGAGGQFLRFLGRLGLLRYRMAGRQREERCKRYRAQDVSNGFHGDQSSFFSWSRMYEAGSAE